MCIGKARIGVPISTSQASANSNPPVIATPFIAPMTGPEKRDSDDRVMRGTGQRCAIIARAQFFKSNPALKALSGTGDNQHACAVIGFSRSMACASSARSASDNAFIASGRFSVSVATPLSISVYNSPIAFLPLIAELFQHICHFVKMVGSSMVAGWYDLILILAILRIVPRRILPERVLAAAPRGRPV